MSAAKQLVSRRVRKNLSFVNSQCARKKRARLSVEVRRIRESSRCESSHEESRSSTLKRWPKAGDPRQSQPSADAIEEILGVESPHRAGYLEEKEYHERVMLGKNVDALLLLR